MTNNQLSYLNLQETKRNNFITSKETARHNKVNEKLQRNLNLETKRHDLVSESNQAADIKSGVKKTQIAADASKYAADVNAKTSIRNTDMTNKSNVRIASQSNETKQDIAELQAQTQLGVAYVNKEVQEAHDKMNKIINDGKMNNDTKLQMLRNSSDQLVQKLNRELTKYKIDTERDLKLKQLEQDLITAAAKQSSSGKKTIIIGKVISELSNYIKSLIRK